MVPKGWEKHQVSEICKLQNGNSFKPKDWDTKGLPIIRIQNLNGSSNFNYFSGEPLEKWLVNPGQLLFSWAGTKGVSFGPFIWNGPKGVLNQHIYKVFANSSVDKNWLYLALRWITNKIEAQAHGFKATLLHVQKKDIDNQIVLVPSLPEQKKIAQISSAWDKAITTSEQLLANSRQQKKALMQQLLTGKKRLLDNNGVRFGGEWKPTAISKFIKESRVAGNSGDLAKKITVKLYGNGVVAKDEKRAGSESTKYYRRSAGQFIYSKLDFLNGAFGIIPDCLDGYESTLDLPAFDFLDGVCVSWFVYFVSREEFYTANLGLANGGRKARRVNPGDLLKVRIPTPEPEEQQKIAAVLTAADQEITILQQKFDALKQEKKALMQQLLTGKRRVKIN